MPAMDAGIQTQSCSKDAIAQTFAVGASKSESVTEPVNKSTPLEQGLYIRRQKNKKAVNAES